jgi:hypothetical protein
VRPLLQQFPPIHLPSTFLHSIRHASQAPRKRTRAKCAGSPDHAPPSPPRPPRPLPLRRHACPTHSFAHHQQAPARTTAGTRALARGSGGSASAGVSRPPALPCAAARGCRTHGARAAAPAPHLRRARAAASTACPSTLSASPRLSRSHRGFHWRRHTRSLPRTATCGGGRHNPRVLP